MCEWSLKEESTLLTHSEDISHSHFGNLLVYAAVFTDLSHCFDDLRLDLNQGTKKRMKGHYVTESRFGSRLWCQLYWSQHINLVWLLMKKCLQKIKEQLSDGRLVIISFINMFLSSYLCRKGSCLRCKCSVILDRTTLLGMTRCILPVK